MIEMLDHLSAGLRLTGDGRLADAASAFKQAADAGSKLGDALASLVAGQAARSPYEKTETFQVFINGGGNVELYSAVHAALAELHLSVDARSLLDIGAGDGRALLPPLSSSRNSLARLGVVEPTSELLDGLKAGLGKVGLNDGTEVELWPKTLQSFLECPHVGPKWALAQATFSLQSVEPGERTRALRELRSRIDRLAIIEFDVPDLEAGSEEEIASIAARFESGLIGYGEQATLVAEGFLAPMLLGKVRDPSQRHNWEQPADLWVRELTSAGYEVDEVRTVALYSWSPAFLLVARPHLS